MKYVTIRRCPSCPEIGAAAAELAGELRDRGAHPQIVDGTPGEFGVEVDGRHVTGIRRGEVRSPNEIEAEVSDAVLEPVG